MLGIPDEGGLQFVGRVGTGFTEKELTKLRETLKPLETDESPFNTRLPTQDAQGSDVRPARSWSGRCATASGPPTADCVSRAGVGCGRTRRPTRSYWE